MDDENLLLGEPDTPEVVQNHIFSIMDKIYTGKRVELLTEKDVQLVEEAIRKIQNGLTEAKKSMLTEEDILNVANLNFASPAPMKCTSNETADAVKSFDFSSPLRDATFSDADELLDYEESINNESVTSEESRHLEIDEDYMEVVRQPTEIAQEIVEKPQKSAGNKRKSAEREVKLGMKLVKTHINTSKIEDIICLSSDSDSDSDAVRVTSTKRQKIVYDLKKEEESFRDFDADDEDDDNVSKANFSRKLTKENCYLKLRESRTTVNSDKLGLTYPLGVTFDQPSDNWFVTNQPYQSDGGTGKNGCSKVVKIYVGLNKKKPKYTDIEGPLIENPMAITVYKAGSQVAVLTSACGNGMKPSIRLINFKRQDKVSTFCTYRSEDLDFVHPCRGLARTKGGNLMTTDRPMYGPPRIRIFSKRSSSNVKEITYLLKNATLPSFIASSDDTVVVTDLGSPQTVLHMKIDDSDWKNVKFEMLRVITTTGVNMHAEAMLNNQYFIYVSGVQIDKNGNIIVADAKNHHFKLFHPSMKFISRISTDFPVPYVSSFHVNQHGECLILSTRETKKIHFAKLTSTNRLEKHIKSGTGKRIGVRSVLSSKRLRFKDDDDSD